MGRRKKSLAKQGEFCIHEERSTFCAGDSGGTLQLRCSSIDKSLLFFFGPEDRYGGGLNRASEG